ncbi:MAG: M20/M25/M40 family metallo-hydrolase [Candidatus Latescibacterota bacterium]|jgi:acetylornithine deacetylase/succinyl-diaminopimelate desuccinylase-like protein
MKTITERAAGIVTTIVLCGLFAAGSAAADSPVEAARAYYADNAGRIVAEYAEFLSLPNRAGDDDDIRRNAQWLRDALDRRGVKVELLEVPGASPVVYGVLAAPGSRDGRRTVGFYAHYDGQAVVAEKWALSPWKATLYRRAIEEGGVPRPFPGDGDAIDPEWRLYARSVADDKAPFMALLAALDAMRGAGIALQTDLVFFLEGEEEAGSPHLGDYMDRYGDKLNADVWLIFDGPTHQSGRPQLVFGVRGITGVDITVYGANRYLHSGHYGNWAPNPGMMLSQLLASMKDENGRVLVDGFYDTVVPPGPAEIEAAKSLPDIDDELRRDFGLAMTEADNAPYLDRIMLPSLNVRGLDGGAVGAKARNVIPPSATAAIDIRLVKGNDPADMLEKVESHIRKQGYYITRTEPTGEERLAHDRIARVNPRGGYRAVRTSMDLPVVRWVEERARAAAGEDMVLMPTMGGSLPLYLFEDKLKKPIVIVPIVNYDNNQHGPNENLRMGNLEYGVMLIASLFWGQS